MRSIEWLHASNHAHNAAPANFRAPGDLLRDLEKEFDEFERRRSRTRGGATDDAAAGPKSLWEELADIGEELVDFLEKELGLSEGEEAAQQTQQQQQQENGGGGSSNSGSSSSNSGSSSKSGSSSSSSRSRSSSGTSSSTGGTGGTSGGGNAVPKMERKSTAEVVEDELEALRRKLGIK